MAKNNSLFFSLSWLGVISWLIDIIFAYFSYFHMKTLSLIEAISAELVPIYIYCIIKEIEVPKILYFI